jgi:pimeloyl-ACP methyl ester carboxylesterase
MTDFSLGSEPLIRELEAKSQYYETVSDGRKTTWRIWGEGPSVMLLHGSHGGWPHFVRNIDALLAAGRKVVVPDLPGFGASEPPEDVHSPDDHTKMLEEGLAQLPGVERCIDVAAFSLGALLGLILDARDPARVRKLIIIDAGGLGTPVQDPDMRSTKGVAKEDLVPINRHNLGAMMLWSPAKIDDLAVKISLHYGPLCRTKVQWQVLPDKLVERVAAARAPIDLIWADHDFPHPGPEINAAVIRQFQPEAALHVIRDSGHWCMYEQAEQFNAALKDLLARPLRARLA